MRHKVAILPILFRYWIQILQSCTNFVTKPWAWYCTQFLLCVSFFSSAIHYVRTASTIPHFKTCVKAWAVTNVVIRPVPTALTSLASATAANVTMGSLYSTRLRRLSGGWHATSEQTWVIGDVSHPGGHCWCYYPGALSLCQVTATHWSGEMARPLTRI